MTVILWAELLSPFHATSHIFPYDEMNSIAATVHKYNGFLFYVDCVHSFDIKISHFTQQKELRAPKHTVKAPHSNTYKAIRGINSNWNENRNSFNTFNFQQLPIVATISSSLTFGNSPSLWTRYIIYCKIAEKRKDLDTGICGCYYRDVQSSWWHII